MPEQGEKTEAPTPRRRSEAREEGNVAHSQDLTAAVMLLGGVILLGVFGRRLFGGFKMLVEMMLGGDWSADVAKTGDTPAAVTVGLNIGMTIVLPLVLGMFAMGIVANLLQVGILFSPKSLTPKFSKLSPIKGAQNLFSKRATMRLVMALGKVALVVLVSGIYIYFDFPKVMSLMRLEAGPLFAAAAALVYALSLKIAVVLLILALIDWIYQKWQHEEDLKMTKEEVKEEMKRMEGDPLVKQRRSKVARQLAMQRVSQAVPQADVVVTNPTHYAIALKYDENMAAPKVIAKGVDFMAMRIRQLAAANDVPIVERPPLARALYRHVEVNEEIPVKYYAAVAEILAYVYRLSKARRRSA